MVENGHGAAVVEIEVAVVREIADCRRMGLRAELDAERSGIGQAMGAASSEAAWVTHIPVFGDELLRHEIGAMVDEGPNPLAEAFRAAVQLMLAEEVTVELILMSVENKTGIGDAVGAAPRDSAKIRRVTRIVLEPLKPEHQRRCVAVKAQVLHDGAPAHDMGGQPPARDLCAPNDALGRLTKDLTDRHDMPPIAAEAEAAA
jgi:hypothetical protein